MLIRKRIVFALKKLYTVRNMSRKIYLLPNEICYNGVSLPGNVSTPELIEKVKDLQTRKGDVIVSAYPRSGNNWMQYATYLIQNSRYDDGSEIPHIKKRFMLEFSINGTYPKSDLRRAEVTSVEERILMTHLYLDKLENQIVNQGCKTIVVIRNPKDVLKSLYHFYQNGELVTAKFTGTWDEYFETYKAKRLMYGDWLDNVTTSLRYTHLPNVLMVKYEEAKLNLRNVLLKLAAFLEKDLCEERLNEIEQLLQLKEMKKHPMVRGDHLEKSKIIKKGALLQTGRIGDWKEIFTKEQSDYVDNQCCELMKRFDYELKSSL